MQPIRQACLCNTVLKSRSGKVRLKQYPEPKPCNKTPLRKCGMPVAWSLMRVFQASTALNPLRHILILTHPKPNFKIISTPHHAMTPSHPILAIK